MEPPLDHHLLLAVSEKDADTGFTKHDEDTLLAPRPQKPPKGSIFAATVASNGRSVCIQDSPLSIIALVRPIVCGSSVFLEFGLGSRPADASQTVCGLL